jgi:ABC-type amino acid transport system permease subunit
MLDAAKSIGLTRWKTFRMIIMPQVFANALPALGNQAALLFKDTSLLSAIAVVEVMLQAKLLVESSGSVYQPFLIAWGLYLAAITVIDLVFTGVRKTIRWR